MLSTSKVAAGGLAAATAAVFGSSFGAFGTVGGAAAGSVVTALSSEIFQRSIDRTADRLRRTNRDTGQGEQAEPAHGLSMGSILVGSILVFALGMAAVTGLEYLTDEPLSGGSEQTTTIGHLAHLDVGSAVGGLLDGSSSEESSKDGILGRLLHG